MIEQNTPQTSQRIEQEPKFKVGDLIIEVLGMNIRGLCIVLGTTNQDGFIFWQSPTPCWYQMYSVRDMTVFAAHIGTFDHWYKRIEDDTKV
jgi:hypothetical protein